MKFSECWYRHLHTTRDDEFLLKSQQFVNNIRESPFVIGSDTLGGTNMGKVSAD